MAARRVITGAPGKSWVNRSQSVRYQYRCSFLHSCGVCIQYAGQISDSPWPIPLHRGCACESIPVLPGHAAAPFVDYAAEVAALGPVERRRVMGKSSYALVQSGAVEWTDVVTPTRIRPFAEVVERAGLTERALVNAGVAPRQARQAHEALPARQARARAAAEAKLNPPPPPPAQPRPKPRAVPAGPPPTGKLKDGRPAYAEAAAGGLAEGQTWVKDRGATAGNYRVVLVDVAKFNAALATDPEFHVGPGGTGLSAVGGRYPEAQAFLAKARAEGIAVEMPRVYVNERGRASISDGRHRFAVLRDSGATVIPVAVPRDAERRLRTHFGAEIPGAGEVRFAPRPRAGAPAVLPPREPTAAPPPARTPIGAKLAAWTEGDARVAALQALDDETTLRLRGAATRTRARLDAAVQALKAAGPDDLAALRQLKDLAEGDLEAAEGRLARVLRDQRRAAQAALGVPEAQQFGWDHAITGKGWDLAEQQRLAAAFVEPLVRAGGGSVVQSRIEWKSTPKTGRSNYRNQEIRMTPGREEAVAIHEWGHAIENQVPGVRTAAREFLAHRVGDEAPRTLADLFPGQGYRPDETGRRDHFDDHFEGVRAYYVGKVYTDGSTEVVSMGLEALYRDPARFAREDPEMCKFVLGVLSGDLR